MPRRDRSADRGGVAVGVRRLSAFPPAVTLWVGLDLVGDGTFWAGNYHSSNVYQFNLVDGTRLASVNAGTPANTVVGIRVMR